MPFIFKIYKWYNNYTIEKKYFFKSGSEELRNAYLQHELIIHNNVKFKYAFVRIYLIYWSFANTYIVISFH